MKKLTHSLSYMPLTTTCSIFCVLLLIFGSGCKKNEIHFLLKSYQQTNLVSDIDGFGAARLDPNLTNAWGIAVAPSGPLWISANHSGVSTIYDKTGATLRPPVWIPAHDPKSPGAPTGQIFNSTTDFKLPSNGLPGKFIFAGEDGTVSTWNGGDAATIVADRSAWDAVYKGIAMANDGTGNFLYLANFKGSKVDVFDKNFQYVTDKPFNDPEIPADYGPFNIRNIEGKLFVTYAKHLAPDNEDDEGGPGHGFVDIFSPNGHLLKRFASRGALNSPWGIVPATLGFCEEPNAILIGNFGDGHISVYSEHGIFVGQLNDKWGKPIAIEGLWALENNVPGTDPNQLFFTAGPNGETNGLFGYLMKK